MPKKITRPKNTFFGETLKEVRIKLKLTQTKASERAGMTQALWSAYETGKIHPSLDFIFDLAEKLELNPIEDLILPTERKRKSSADE
jgi:transcriptional regulator with XRE-family HTH domain